MCESAVRCARKTTPAAKWCHAGGGGGGGRWEYHRRGDSHAASRVTGARQTMDARRVFGGLLLHYHRAAVAEWGTGDGGGRGDGETEKHHHCWEIDAE